MTEAREIPVAFEAFEESAAYVEASLTRSQAITQGRDASYTLQEDYDRRDLRAVRVHMRSIEGEEAQGFFEDEYDSGWLECHKDEVGAIPMWKVEPR